MRPTGHPKRQILAMLDQQTRKTIRRHMADSQRLRLETLPNHLQQKPMVRTLLEKYQIHVNGSTSQAGKKFSASLILNPDNTVKFDFSQ